MSLAFVVPDLLHRLLAEQGGDLSIWVVGGALRDHFLERPVHDLDLVVDGNAVELARRLSKALGGAYYDLDRGRGAGRILKPSRLAGVETLDLVRLHEEGIEHDLLSRDFTANALGIHLQDSQHLLDPAGGLQDIKHRRLRACSPSAIDADPVRALRGVRLALTLGFVLEPDTRRQIRNSSTRLGSVSSERLRDEFMLMLTPRMAGRAVRLLDHLGLLDALCPDLVHLRGKSLPPRTLTKGKLLSSSPGRLIVANRDAWEHTLRVVLHLDELTALLAEDFRERGSGNMMLAEASLRLGRFRPALKTSLGTPKRHGRSAGQINFLAALYHEAGLIEDETERERGAAADPELASIRAADRVRSRCRRLRLSAAERRFAGTILRHALRPSMLAARDPIQPLDVYRFFRDAGEAGIAVVFLALADSLAEHVPHPPMEAWRGRLQIARQLLEAYFEGPPQALHPPPLIRGDQLAQSLGGLHGPQIGRLLQTIEEAQVEGRVGSPKQAIELARRILDHGAEE